MKRAISAYFYFQFFFPLLLWVPIFYEYQRYWGLTDEPIFFIQSLYYIVFCLFEVPTGLAADRWGYRSCLRLGSVLLVAATVLPISSPTYWGFLIHFVLVALSRSFVSGAASAYLYDLLAFHKQAGRFKEIEGKSRAYGLVGKIVGWAAIGSLMQWHVTVPYWLSLLTAVASAGFAWAMPALPGGREAREQRIPTGALAPLSGLWKLLRGHPFFLLLTLQGIGIFVLARIGTVDLFQPILKAKSFDLGVYGLMMSGITVFEALGSARHGWIQRWLNDLNAVFVLSLAMAVALALIPFGGQIGTVVLLGVFSWLTGLSYPIQRQLMNDAIPDSRYRATFLSLESILDRAACALVALQMGGYLQANQLDKFLCLSGAGTIVFLSFLFLSMRKQGKGAAGVGLEV